MMRSPGAAGFRGRPAPVASSRLTNAVAASLAIGALSLCLIVALTVLSIKVDHGDADSGVNPCIFLSSTFCTQPAARDDWHRERTMR